MTSTDPVRTRRVVDMRYVGRVLMTLISGGLMVATGYFLGSERPVAASLMALAGGATILIAFGIERARIRGRPRR